MARYQAVIAYDGTEFAGFQRQLGQESRTVQGEVEAVLRQLGWQGQKLLGAGRTDTGVHAAGQVIAFDLEWAHPLESLQAALNAGLPPDVAVMAVRTTRPDFHPRYDAASRRYQYRIFCRAGRDPLRERYSWRVWPGVDIERMKAAAALLVGEHDFAAFGTPPKAERSTVRTVYSAEWRPGDSLEPVEWKFEIVANAFLYHMVRRLVYVLAAIGQGRLEVSAFRQALEEPPQLPLQGLAPPQGLTLMEVLYPEDVHLRRSSGLDRERDEVSTGPGLDKR
jgi:tRNA pseudouridine38-40 synthase